MDTGDVEKKGMIVPIGVGCIPGTVGTADPVGRGGTVGMPFPVGAGVPDPVGTDEDTGVSGYGVTKGESDWFATGACEAIGDEESLYM